MDSKQESRKQAILNFCKEQDKDITEHDIVKDSYYDDIFTTPVGRYYVLTDEEADKTVQEIIERQFDDRGLEAFPFTQQEMICDEYLCESSKQEMLEDIRNSTIDDIKKLSEREQKEKIVEFLNSNKGNEPYGKEIAEFLENYSEKADEYIEKYADNIVDKYRDNPIEYYKENFEDDYLYELDRRIIIDLDFEEIAKDFTSDADCDRTDYISVIDGLEHEQEVDGETFYIYLEDVEKNRKVVDMALEIIENNEGFESVAIDDVIGLLNDCSIERSDLEKGNAEKISQCFEKNLEEEVEYE